MHGARSSEVDLVPDHQIRKKKAPGKLTVLVNGEIEIGLPALGGFIKTILVVVARLEVVAGIKPDLLTELASKRKPVTPSDERPRMFQATTETRKAPPAPSTRRCTGRVQESLAPESKGVPKCDGDSESFIEHSQIGRGE